MNARSQIFELSVEGRQVEEVVLSLFHTLLFHRTLGKFHYKQEGSYSVGTIGYEDVDCDFVDITYVQCSSEALAATLKNEISAFSNDLLSNDSSRGGQISMEFYQKRTTRWPFAAECIPWEIWTIKLNLVTLSNEHERQLYREKMGEVIAEKILYIAEAVNRHDYVPKMPSQSELELIFDTNYTDVQPYLFKITYQTTVASNTTVGMTMRKLIKDTLSL